MGREAIYWFIVLLSFAYILFKNKGNSIKILIILCFYSGLAAFFGKTIENPYKIVLVLISVYALLKYDGLSGLGKREGFLLIVFILFSVSFFYSAIINGDYFILIFSQYCKYVTPICLLFVYSRILNKAPDAFINLKKLFFSLLTIQVILSFLKVITIGLREGPVGSIAFNSGGPATMVPILGFIILWLHKQGEIKTRDWIYIFLLLIIGFVSYKRALWFISPAIIFLFMYYVPRKVNGKKILYFLPFIVLILYLGVKFNPTLNKEGSIGGSFDLQYVRSYILSYNFGKTSETSEIQLGSGRGGATFLLLDNLFNKQTLTTEDYWGVGLAEIYTTDYEQFDNEKFGVSGKGAVTGIFQSYISSGYIGVLVTIFLIISVFNLIKEPKIRISIAFLMFWDYFFYSGLLLRTQSLFVLLFFIIVYSNLQFDQGLFEKVTITKPNVKNRYLQTKTA